MPEIEGKGNLPWITTYHPRDLPGGYLFPDRIISRPAGKEISIRDHREKRGGLLDSSKGVRQTKVMMEFLEGDKIKYIREFIFLVYQEMLGSYQKNLKHMGFTLDKNEPRDLIKKKMKIWERNYFSADFYLPGYGCILELDSDYHDIPSYDCARDRLILEYYGVPTYRFWRFDKNFEYYQKALQGVLKNPLPELWYPEILINVEDLSKVSLQ